MFFYSCSNPSDHCALQFPEILLRCLSWFPLFLLITSQLSSSAADSGQRHVGRSHVISKPEPKFPWKHNGKPAVFES
jgi:hypothetical protein